MKCLRGNTKRLLSSPEQEFVKCGPRGDEDRKKFEYFLKQQWLRVKIELLKIIWHECVKILSLNFVIFILYFLETFFLI